MAQTPKWEANPMKTAALPKPLSAEEAARLGLQGRWELVRGEVVTYMPVQPEHGMVVSELNFRVRGFLGSAERAIMGPEIGFIVARQPDTVRAPDWAFLWRQEAEARRRGPWLEGAPTWAVEVVSPEERWGEVQEKVDEYLRAGSQLVWVVDLQRRTVHVFRPDGPVEVFREGEVLSGDPVLPGFTLPVTALFPPPEAEGIRHEPDPPQEGGWPSR